MNFLTYLVTSFALIFMLTLILLALGACLTLIVHAAQDHGHE